MKNIVVACSGLGGGVLRHLSVSSKVQDNLGYVHRFFSLIEKNRAIRPAVNVCPQEDLWVLYSKG